MMRRLGFAISTLLIGMMTWSEAGHGQAPPNCGVRSDVIVALAQRYAERPISFGLNDTGQLVEIFASPQGSWTILLTSPNGRSCLLSAGQFWEQHIARPVGYDG